MILFLSAFLWLAPEESDSDFQILILDDCKEWSISEHPWKPNEQGVVQKQRFFVEKSWTRVGQYVRISFFWFYPEEELATINMTYSQIINSNYQYTSELSFEDWFCLLSKNIDTKFFVLLPIDYCSEKRFVLNQEFILYEINIRLPFTE